MRIIIIAFCCLFTVEKVRAQDSLTRGTWLSLSGGQAAFGSGDVVGYSISIGAATQVNKESRFALNRLLLGGEMFFENGVNLLSTGNVSGQTWIFGSFRHNSNTVLWGKILYYPFQRILPGLHVGLGPTAGYSLRSLEGSSRISRNVLNEPEKFSEIVNENGFTIGYRISTGLDFNVSHRFVLGIRVDFSNNNLAEINTFVGVKTAIVL